MVLVDVVVAKAAEVITAEALGVTLNGSKRALRWLRARLGGKPDAVQLKELLQRHPQLTEELARELLDPDRDAVVAAPSPVKWFTDFEQHRVDLPPDGVYLVAGPTGAGKTELVRKIAEEQREAYLHGVVAVPLQRFRDGGVLDISRAQRWVLDQCRVPQEAQPSSRDELAAMYQRVTLSLQLLLIVDAVASKAELQALRPSCPASLVLATTQVLTPDLAAAADRCDTLGGLPPDDARKVLARVCGEAMVADEPRAVDELLQLCDHLPGAIELIGIEVQRRDGERAPVRGLVAEYRKRGISGALETIVAELERAFAELTPEGRRLCRLLAELPPPDFSRQVVAAIADSGELDTLVERGLVRKNGGRYRLRVVAAEHARRVEPLDFDAQTALAERLVDVYRDALVRLDTGDRLRRYQESEPQKTEVSPAEELDVIPAVVRMAHEQGRHVETCQLAGAYEVLLNEHGRWREYEAIADFGLRSARVLHERGHAGVQLLIRAEQMYARAMTMLRRFDDAETHLKRAFALVEPLNRDDKDTAQLASSVLEFQARLTEERADAERHREPPVEADYTAAIDDFRRAVELDERFDDRRAHVIHVRMLANVLVKDGRAAEAKSLLADLFTIDEPRNVARVHMVNAAACAASGDGAEARASLQRARQLLRKPGQYDAELRQLESKVLAAEGDVEGAAQVIGELIDEAIRIGHPRTAEYINDLRRLREH